MHREFHTVAGRSKRVLGSIKKQLTGVELCKDMLVILPTEHIVRGFLIEATSTKDRIYLWKVVTPLHRPMRDVILDYSDRIFPETGEDIYIYKDDYERSIDRLRALVANHMAGLSRIRSPCDFLRHIDWMRGNKSTLFRFDLALTYFRIGRVRECANLLCALDSEIDQ